MKKFICVILVAIALAFSAPQEVKASQTAETVYLYYYQVSHEAGIEYLQNNDPAWFFTLQNDYFIANNFLLEMYTNFPNETEEWYINMIDSQWENAMLFYFAYNL